MQIEILDYTEKPLTMIGLNAAECYNTTLKDENHASRIARHCIESGHGRNLEFVDVNIIIKCISARMARELYTHIGGAPTRVQASTRYIDYSNFKFITPKGMTKEQQDIYKHYMDVTTSFYKVMKGKGADNDILGYMLPLGMETTVCLKMNIRTLENMFNQRLCVRALKEFRAFMYMLKMKLKQINEEWEWICNNLFVCKCQKYGYCLENKDNCIFPKKSEVIKND